ncbi:MAG: hypothetical protein JNM07_13130 [Phycisphaerae bacterium]|nr:hypothetical protein [Phycisphaerae bacterium]
MRSLPLLAPTALSPRRAIIGRTLGLIPATLGSERPEGELVEDRRSAACKPGIAAIAPYRKITGAGLAEGVAFVGVPR